MAIEKISVICIRSLVVTVYDYMFQSASRKNFADILLDPTAIGVLGSIALHAILAANLAFFTQVTKEVKKPAPDTVKVVELTPTELQRIPQAPPTPSQQVLPSAYKPTTPVPPINTPTAPAVAATQTIPSSPKVPKPILNIPAPTPSQRKGAKSSGGNKDQIATKQGQPPPPIGFNDDIKPDPFPTPTPTPTPTPNKTETVRKTPPGTTKNKKVEDTRKSKGIGTDPDGGGGPPLPSETRKTISQSQGGTLNNEPTTPSSSQSTEQPPGGENGVGMYGKYTKEANVRLQEYEKLYPGIVERSGKPRALTIPYPATTVCPKSPRKPFIVLMVVFGKVTAQDSALGSDTTGEPTGKPYVAYDQDTPENKELGVIAVRKALEVASIADQNRAEKNKDKEFLYQYRVTFDPTTCKKQ